MTQAIVLFLMLFGGACFIQGLVIVAVEFLIWWLLGFEGDGHSRREWTTNIEGHPGHRLDHWPRYIG